MHHFKKIIHGLTKKRKSARLGIKGDKAHSRIQKSNGEATPPKQRRLSYGTFKKNVSGNGYSGRKD